MLFHRKQREPSSDRGAQPPNAPYGRMMRMVRPEASDSLAPGLRGPGSPLACCVELAGASPALVIAGEPGSRLPPLAEMPAGKRSVESPSSAVWLASGEQSCGPSLKRTLQPREIGPRKGGVGRAGHFTAKATDCIRRSGRVQDAPGVGRRARSDSLTRNRRGPHWLPTLGAGAAYKRDAKWQRAGRESEGLIVPLRPGESREAGRGPALVVLACGGKGEGMA